MLRAALKQNELELLETKEDLGQKLLRLFEKVKKITKTLTFDKTNENRLGCGQKKRAKINI